MAQQQQQQQPQLELVDVAWSRAVHGGGGGEVDAWYVSASSTRGAALVGAEASADETGVLPWAGTDALGEFVAHPDVRARLLRRKSVLELGAGCGVVGLLCASPAVDADVVVLTDAADNALELARRGALRSMQRHAGSRVVVEPLDWLCFTDQLARIKTHHLLSAHQRVDVVLACDVVYPNTNDAILAGLCDTLVALLEPFPRVLAPVVTVDDLVSSCPPNLALFAVVDRDRGASVARFARIAAAKRLRIHAVAPDSFASRPLKLDGVVLAVTLDEDADDDDDDDDENARFAFAAQALPTIQTALTRASLSAQPCTCSEAACGDTRCSCSRCVGLREGCAWALSEEEALPFPDQ